MATETKTAAPGPSPHPSPPRGRGGRPRLGLLPRPACGERDGARGFALPAAVLGVAIFALLALAIIDWGRGTTALLRAETLRVRLEAAADAGLNLAIHGLAIEDRTLRWPVGGGPRRILFDGVSLDIAVEDERGKVPINSVDTPVIRAMLAHAGASGLQLDELTDAVEDWIDEDDTPRLHGAEKDAYAGTGVVPRNAGFRTIGEIGLVKGMTPRMLAVIAPLVSLIPRADIGIVDGRQAGPEVLAIMSGDGIDSFAVINRRREEAGQQVAIDIADDEPVALRMVTIRVTAAMAGGARLDRVTTVEFTGDPRKPFWIRAAR